ncbi:hypothetical protein Tdes44962_MAKER00796 [Teratosphaeria destructans]|uniref:Uncharacterized protein n=1 Tax=Teratosphaeria destructans TaxID=418781 RepID=A0A9W7SKK9_9PEZI|nr:hypothetical protein Tdes44962_MAKER00796 [Teratosphaeria destructans]
MPPQGQAEAKLRAIISVTLIYALGEIIVRHLRQGVLIANLPEHLRPEPDTLKSESAGHFHFYVKHLPGLLLANFGKAIIDYEWQRWLEETYPGWVSSRSRRAARGYLGDKAEKLRDVLEDRKLEKEVLRRLIAEGKAQRPSPWLNTVAKWVLDNFVAATVFGLAEALIFSIWAGDAIILFTYLTVHIWVNPFLHFFSTKPLVSFISFIFVPVHHRITFLAGADVLTGVFYGVFLNGLAAWILNQEWTLELLRNASATAGNSSDTLERNGVSVVEHGNVLWNVSEAVGMLKNGSVAWQEVRVFADEL